MPSGVARPSLTSQPRLRLINMQELLCADIWRPTARRANQPCSTCRDVALAHGRGKIMAMPQNDHGLGHQEHGADEGLEDVVEQRRSLAFVMMAEELQDPAADEQGEE